MHSEWVRLEDVTVCYDGHVALEDATLRLEGPGLVQVLGPNGAGKTTLLRAIAGLVKPCRGRVYACGVEVTGDPGKAGGCVGYVPQRPPLGESNPLTVWDFTVTRALLEKPWPRLRAPRSVRERVEAALLEAGVEREAWNRRLWELSGGQLMRVFIARSLLGGPRVLLLDEPLGPVDPAGKASLARTIAGLARERLVIVTSHDPELLLPYTDLIVLIRRRIIAVGRPEEVLRREVLYRVYGESLQIMHGHVHLPDEHYPGVARR